MTTEITTFETPVNDMRGIATASMSFGGRKDRRVAHSYLYTDKQPEISLDRVAIKLTLEQLNQYINELSEFAKKVSE